MPGARMFRIVVMMLMAPMIDDAPMMCTAKMVKSMPGPIWVDSGTYMVQPPAGAPPGTKNEAASKSAAGGSSQNEKLFIRAKAMSGAPFCSGIIQFAMPTKAGIIAPKNKNNPNNENNKKKISGLNSCRPG